MAQVLWICLYQNIYLDANTKKDGQHEMTQNDEVLKHIIYCQLTLFVIM